MKARILRQTVVGIAGFFMLSALPGFAGESGWRFFAKATYRTIDDVDFSRITLANPAFAPATDGVNQYSLVNGTFDLGTGAFQISDAGQYDSIGWIPATPGMYGTSQTSVFLDQVTAGAQNTDFHHGTAGLMLGIEKPWRVEDGGVRLSFQASFWYAADDIDDAANLAVDSLDLSLSLVDGGNGVIDNPNPLSDSDATGDDFVFANDVNTGTTSTAAAAAMRSLDLNLYVFSAGIDAAYELGKGLALHCGTGPTLNLARIQTRLGANVTSGAATYTWKQTDTDTDVAFGWYGGIGIAYQASERISLGLDWRYDWVFQDVGTDQATVDLDGQSLAISVTIAF